MTNEELAKRFDELKSLLDFHTDMLGVINAQGVTNTARCETVLSILREVLARQGIEKQKSQDICKEVFAKCLLIAQSENQESLKRMNAGQSFGSPNTDPERN